MHYKVFLRNVDDGREIWLCNSEGEKIEECVVAMWSEENGISAEAICRFLNKAYQRGLSQGSK